MADSPLQFEHAEHAAASATLMCAGCGQQIRDQYYEIGGRTLCDSCRRQFEANLAQGAGVGAFARAAGLGALAAVGGAVLWYAVESLTGWSAGIIAIAVGYMVGRAVHHGSRGRGGWLYQTLAVVLTYLAIVSTYIPEIAAGLATSEGRQVPAIIRFPLIAVASLIAPFLAVFYGGIQHIIGLLIIFFGLSQAWRMNRRVELRVSGPFRVGAPAPESAPTGA
jgi:hypothetical protein